MFKIKVTKQQAINNAKKVKNFCLDLKIAIIKSLDILKQYDGKMINKKIVDTINTYFESVFINTMNEHIKCTVSFCDSCKGKSLKYHIGYLDLDGEEQNFMPPDLMLLLTDNDGKFDFESTKETEFSKTIYNIIDFEKEYQDIADNYTKYSRLVNNIYSAMKEYNEQRSGFICPYIPLINF